VIADSAASTNGGTLDVGWSPWALCVLLAMAAGAVLLRRRLAGSTRRASAGGSVRLVETTRLSEHAKLSVIHFRERELLVAHGTHGTTLLVDRRLDEGPLAP
jgi:hypothetical protein